MRIVVVLICLALNHFVEIKQNFRPYHWFYAYRMLIAKYGKRYQWFSGWVALAMLLLPLLLAVLLLACIFCHWLGLGFSVLYSGLIVLYCLGPDDLLWQAKRYHASVTAQDDQQAAYYQAIVGDMPAEDQSQAMRLLTEKIVMLANPRLFAVIFWYLVLGVFGAVLYRFSYVLAHMADDDVNLQSFAQRLVAYLDWLPVRLLTLIYALVGDFIGAFGRWVEFAGKGVAKNNTLLRNCGLAACAADDKVHCGDGDLAPVAAMALVKRSTVVCCIVVALIGIAAWFL